MHPGKPRCSRMAPGMENKGIQNLIDFANNPRGRRGHPG